MLLVNHASSKPNKEIFVVSSELTKMRITVIKDFIKIMRMFGIYEDARMLGGTLYRFPNGSFIKFLGLDKEDIGKGLRSDVIFVNEANKISFEAFRELTSRAKNTYLDFNPNKPFWAHEEVITRNDADFIKLTYKDNEFLSPQEVEEIERYKTKGYNEQGEEINAYWANKWRVYGLGQEGMIEGAIFSNWTTGDFDDNLSFGYCVDFGYKDPFTLTKIAINKKERKMYLQQIIYKSFLSSDDIILLMDQHEVDKEAYIVADSADPTQIRNIQEKGYNIYKANKGKIIEGITALQNYDIIICGDSPDIVNEFSNYIWLDKRGEVPIDNFNHVIDPVRYYEKFYNLIE